MTDILALDLGTKTGWAMRSAGRVSSGVWSFKPDRFCGAGMRFVRLRRQLGMLPRPDRVVFERIERHGKFDGTATAHLWGGWFATLTAWCEDQGISDYEGISVQAIKIHATGKGNAGKPAMVAAVRAMGYEPADDNEADALALLHYAMRQDAEATATA
jgi:hypothetical protein